MSAARKCSRCGATITGFAGYEPGKGELCLECYREFQRKETAVQIRTLGQKRAGE